MNKNRETKVLVSKVKKTGERRKLVSLQTIFGIIITILTYFLILVISNIFIEIKSESDQNYTNNILSIILILVAAYVTFLKTIKKTSKKVLAKKYQEQKTKENTAQLFHQKYINGQRLFKTQIPSKVISGVHDLLDVAIAFPDKRQKIINLLLGKNQWMGSYADFLKSKNLVTWRLKKKLFFELPQDPQTISLEVLTAVEKIIKKHCLDFTEQEDPKALDLTSQYIPALNLGFIKFPRKSVIFDYAFCLQINFWQSEIFDISFKSTELQKANFWKSKLSGINFGGAKLNGAKLKTNLTAVHDITPSQFFVTQEWPINILDTEKLKLFFPIQSKTNQRWRLWISKKDERKALAESLNETLIT